jgi:hypothetical protein
MIDLSMIRDFVAIFGVIAGFSYYVLTVRNANIARKTQVVLNLSQNMFRAEQNLMNIELLSMDWEDFDDFRRKYDSTVNPESFSRRWQIWQAYENMGYMLHQGIIDIETLYNMIGPTSILQFWQKFEPIFLEQRRLYGEPHWFRWTEYLVNETLRHRAKLGLPSASSLHILFS